LHTKQKRKGSKSFFAVFLDLVNMVIGVLHGMLLTLFFLRLKYPLYRKFCSIRATHDLRCCRFS